MKPKPKMPVEWMYITPDKAAELLSRPAYNRPLNMTVVESMAARMLAGSWIETPQSITIGSDGNLIDGQHRCAAVLKSNLAQWFVTATDSPIEVFDHTDVDGRGPRSAADLLHHRRPEMSSRKQRCAIASASMRGMRRKQPPPEQALPGKLAVHYEDFAGELITILNRQVETRPSAIGGAFFGAGRAKDDPFPGPKGGYPQEKILEQAKLLTGLSFEANEPMRHLYLRLKRDRDSNKIIDAALFYRLTVTALRPALDGVRMSRLPPLTEIDWDGSISVLRDTKVARFPPDLFEKTTRETGQSEVRVLADGRKVLYDLLELEAGYASPSEACKRVMQKSPAVMQVAHRMQVPSRDGSGAMHEMLVISDEDWWTLVVPVLTDRHRDNALNYAAYRNVA